MTSGRAGITHHKYMCPECDSIFYSTSRTRKYCSMPCSNRYNMRLRHIENPKDRRVLDKRYDAKRPNVTNRGYGQEWRVFRNEYLSNNPDCNLCSSVANEVDHIIPIRHGGIKYQDNNLQSLCKSCHSRKTQEDIKIYKY